MALTKFTTKKGDTGRPFRIRLFGGTTDLTGYTATLTVWKLGAATNKIDKKAMTLLDQSITANKGWFEYYPLAAEIDESGKFLAEVDVTRPDGTKFQLPTDADTESQPYFEFIVLESRA